MPHFAGEALRDVRGRFPMGALACLTPEPNIAITALCSPALQWGGGVRGHPWTVSDTEMYR